MSSKSDPSNGVSDANWSTANGKPKHEEVRFERSLLSVCFFSFVFCRWNIVLFNGLAGPLQWASQPFSPFPARGATPSEFRPDAKTGPPALSTFFTHAACIDCLVAVVSTPDFRSSPFPLRFRLHTLVCDRDISPFPFPFRNARSANRLPRWLDALVAMLRHWHFKILVFLFCRGVVWVVWGSMG